MIPGDLLSAFPPAPGFIFVVPTILELMFGAHKTQIFIHCSCLNAPQCGYMYMNQHCEATGCSFQTLEGRWLIGFYTALFDVVTSWPPYISLGAVGMMTDFI